MVWLVVVLLFFGTGLTILAPVLLLINLQSRRERRRYARMGLSRCADITQPERRLRAVEGRTRPGPAGLLTAPLSGEPCVWYYAEVTWRDGLDGGDSLLWQGGGNIPFAIQDETGMVLIDGPLVHPSSNSFARVGHKLPTMQVVAEESTRLENSAYLRDLVARGILTEKSFKRKSRQRRWGVHEYILRPNIPLHVQGEPIRRNGRVLIGRGGRRRKDLVTTHTYAELRDEIVPEDLRTTTGILLICAVAGPTMLGAGILLMY